MPQDIKFIPSPNFTADKNTPKLIVLHFTAGGIDGAIETFQRGKLSSHYLISKGGDVVQMVKENDVAYHAGKSFWGDSTNLNLLSLGIELENWGELTLDGTHMIRRWTGAVHTGPYHRINKKYWDHFPFIQMNSLVELCKSIKTRYPKIDVVGHSDIAPGRKNDPGPALDINRLLLEVQ